MATNLRALFVAFGIEIDVRLVMVIILLPLTLINWVSRKQHHQSLPKSWGIQFFLAESSRLE